MSRAEDVIACGAGWPDALEPYRVHHDTGTCSCAVSSSHRGLHRCACGGERAQDEADVWPPSRESRVVGPWQETP